MTKRSKAKPFLLSYCATDYQSFENRLRGKVLERKKTRVTICVIDGQRSPLMPRSSGAVWGIASQALDIGCYSSGEKSKPCYL